MSRRDFNSGVEAGAKPFEDKFNRMSNDFQNATNGIYSKIDDLNKVTDFIIDDLNSIEKKRLYDLNIVADIGELGDDEKELLIAILYTLAGMSEEVTQYQQDYLRSIKAYLEVKSVQNKVDLAVIENIESINDQKAFLQTIMEFLFIENADHHYMEEYEDVIDHFSVNKKGIKEIQECINTIYKATGLKGLAEMYGYEPEDIVSNIEESNEGSYTNSDEDISEACADVVNIHNEYISVGKYIVFSEKNNKYSRVEKKSGEVTKFETDEADSFGCKEIGAAGDKFFFSFDYLDSDTRKPILFNVETFEYQTIDVIGIPIKGFVSNAEKLYYFSTLNKEVELVEYNLKSKTNQLIKSEKNEESSYTNHKLILNGNKLYYIVYTAEFSSENQPEEIMMEFDCLTGCSKKICCLENDVSFFNNDDIRSGASGIYNNYLYSITEGMFEKNVYFKYIDLENPTSVRTEKIPEDFVGFLTIYKDWLYYAQLSDTNKVFKYNISTGENTCLMEESKILRPSTMGLFKKKTTYDNFLLNISLIGNWIYYKERSYESIRKVDINTGYLIPFKS